MRLSTRSHYGTIMMVDLAQHYGKSPITITKIARRQKLSPKYIEQIIIPLQQANFVKSLRVPKGGHMLGKPPEEISIGDIIELLEKTTDMTGYIMNPEKYRRSKSCTIRGVLAEASKALYERLHSITLSELVEVGQN